MTARRAFVFYAARTFRNRVFALLRKLKRPRHAIGIVLGLAYFYFFFMRVPSYRQHEFDSADRVENAVAILAGLNLLQTVLAWVFGSSGRGILFRQAEVDLLFPAPLTRRQVLYFKWWQTQFALIMSAAFVALVARSWGGLTWPVAFAGLYFSSNFFWLHSAIVGLAMARWKRAEGRIANFAWVPGTLLLGFIAFCVGAAWNEMGGVETAADLRRLIDTGALRVIMWPFVTFASLAAAPDAATFAGLLPWPIVLIGAHAVVLATVDFRYEDQAVAMAGKFSRIKSEGLEALRSERELVLERPTSPWRLATIGAPWRAFVWKNVISLGRLPGRTWISLSLALITMAVVMSFVLSRFGSGLTMTKVGFLLLIVVGYASLMAPALLRIDLRLDIPHFDVIKAFPLRGRALVFGEILGSVVVIFAAQALIGIIAAVLIREMPDGVVDWSFKGPLLIGGLGALLAVDFALLTVENLFALWFPSFVRLGRGMKHGIESFGQNLIGALLRMFVFVVLFLIPGGIGALVGVTTRLFFDASVAAAIALGMVIGAALSIGETIMLIQLSEGRYDRFDLSAENLDGE